MVCRQAKIESIPSDKVPTFVVVVVIVAVFVIVDTSDSEPANQEVDLSLTFI